MGQKGNPPKKKKKKKEIKICSLKYGESTSRWGGLENNLRNRGFEKQEPGERVRRWAREGVTSDKKQHYYGD